MTLGLPMEHEVSPLFGSQGAQEHWDSGGHNARVQRWLAFLTAFDYTRKYGKGSANGSADFLSRVPEPATEHDGCGSSIVTPADVDGIFLFGPAGFAFALHRPPASAWVGWCPAPIVRIGWATFRLSGFSQCSRTPVTFEELEE